MSNGGVRSFEEILNECREELHALFLKDISKCSHKEIVEIVLFTSTVKECKNCKEVIK